MIRKRLPSPALVIAVLALFVALSGTAVAAGIVPLAKRALVADNAKKLGFLESSDLGRLFDLNALNEALKAKGQPAVASS